jgi:hypothetical protein
VRVRGREQRYHLSFFFFQSLALSSFPLSSASLTLSLTLNVREKRVLACRRLEKHLFRPIVVTTPSHRVASSCRLVLTYHILPPTTHGNPPGQQTGLTLCRHKKFDRGLPRHRHNDHKTCLSASVLLQDSDCCPIRVAVVRPARLQEDTFTPYLTRRARRSTAVAGTATTGCDLKTGYRSFSSRKLFFVFWHVLVQTLHVDGSQLRLPHLDSRVHDTLLLILTPQRLSPSSPPPLASRLGRLRHVPAGRLSSAADSFRAHFPVPGGTHAHSHSHAPRTAARRRRPPPSHRTSALWSSPEQLRPPRPGRTSLKTRSGPRSSTARTARPHR